MMFSKTIKFKDYNGNEQEKEFYFHLSKSELAMLSAGSDDMKAKLERMIKAKDNAAILKELRDLIKLAVGVRSEDGERFIKDADAQSQLLDSPAFDELLFELFVGTNTNEFFLKLVPEEMQKELEEFISKQGGDPFKEPEDTRPAYQKENRKPTDAEQRAMTRAELAEAWKWTEARNK
jgi:hypothetical protein